MRLSARAKLLLAGFITLIILIPGAFYLLAKRTQLPTSKTKIDLKIPHERNSVDPLELLKKAIEGSSSSKPASLNIPTLGPSLNLAVSIEGRPKLRQAAKVFIGIGAGNPVATPKYLISFTVDFPDSGSYKGISLAGLEIGSTYTAYIKGPTQIATASAFVLSSNEVNLNTGSPINLLTGDLNQDNVINSADYSIAKSAYGSRPNSSNWNENVDFNSDGVVNSADLAVVLKNFGKTGSSGAWYSPTPIASSSGGLKAPTESSGSGGYYLWVPNL